MEPFVTNNNVNLLGNFDNQQELQSADVRDVNEVSIHLPNKNTDIILRISNSRNRGDACTHCYFAIDLYEA